MTDYIIRKVATVQGLYDVNEEAVYADLTANPGSLMVDIATRTGLSSTLVENVLKVMVEQQIVKRAYNEAGFIEYHWRMVDWIELILSNRNAARTWLETNDGELVSKMATDLGVAQAIAEALAAFLQQEFSAVLFVQ